MILYFKGPLVSFKAFKDNAPKHMRTILLEEFKAAGNRLMDIGAGTMVEVRARGARSDSCIFIKAEPGNLPENSNIDKVLYESRFFLSCLKSITAGIIDKIRSLSIISEVYNI